MIFLFCTSKNTFHETFYTIPCDGYFYTSFKFSPCVVFRIIIIFLYCTSKGIFDEAFYTTPCDDYFYISFKLLPCVDLEL